VIDSAPLPVAAEDELPRTGGDLLLPGVGLLSAAGLLWGARRRFLR
jgi:LPXTG-motif cell wall-anchored protein